MTLWELLELWNSPGRGRTIAVGQLIHFLTDPPHRPNRGPYRRDLRRLPQERRLALNLWELLELCDSRDSGGSVASCCCLTHRFAAVVASGVSHRFCGVANIRKHATTRRPAHLQQATPSLWELLELCDSPGRGRTIAVGQLIHFLTDPPLSSESRPVPS
jgi:hypothetical protein